MEKLVINVINKQLPKKEGIKRPEYAVGANSQKFDREFYSLVANVVSKALSKSIQSARTAHPTPQDAVDNEMNGMDIGKLDSLDEKCVSPVVRQKLTHPFSAHVPPQPIPMATIHDEKAEIQVAPLVA